MFDLKDAGKADGVTLVHGTVASPSDGFPIEHAWLGGGGEAYDAVKHVIMPVAQYVAERGAVAERRNTSKEMCQRTREGHFGPWHESETLRFEDCEPRILCDFKATKLAVNRHARFQVRPLYLLVRYAVLDRIRSGKLSSGASSK